MKLPLARVVFGVTSSPFLLNGTVRNHVSSYHLDPEFVMQVLRSFFVDDFSGGSKTTTAAFELCKKVKIIFLEGQFSLTKWRTNNKQLRLLTSQIEGTEIPVARSKVLGILCDDENDEFIFNFKEVLEIAKFHKTIRIKNYVCVLRPTRIHSADCDEHENIFSKAVY